MTVRNNRASVVLSPRVVTREGCSFTPSDDDWVLWGLSPGRFTLRFRRMRGIDPSLLPSVKATLSWYAQHASPNHVRGMFAGLQRLFQCGWRHARRRLTLITAETLISFRTDLGEREWELSSTGGVIRRWHALGYPGVDKSAVSYLRAARVKGNPKGVAIARLDPRMGPFSDLEFEALQHSVNDAFSARKLTESDFVLTWLFQIVGARPVQMAALKTCDFVVTGASDGTRAYSLRVPRAKQRGQKLRESFKVRPIIPQIGELLGHHVRSVEARFRSLIANPYDAPLFPAERPEPLAEPGFEWHLSATRLARRLSTAVGSVAPTSERTGRPVHVSMIRFRRTLGTRAAAEGHGPLVIAELLDHSSTDSVRVYVEARADLAERVDRALALQLAPLAKAFAGTVVAGEVAGAPRITDPRFDQTMAHPVGSCGTISTCGFGAPIACYTCRSFRPWRDGPHEAVLDHLLAERARLVDAADRRIASVNDRTILAVAEVVLLCREDHHDV